MSRTVPFHEEPDQQIVLKEVYERRFNDADRVEKEAIWQELGTFLQQYVSPSARVIDIACDRGYFIRNITAGDKWASDVRDMSSALPSDVHFVRASGLELDQVLPADHFDVAFFSNYLEHLPSTEAVLTQLKVSHALLRRGGQVVILQPNSRLIGGRYWDSSTTRPRSRTRALLRPRRWRASNPSRS